MRWTWILVGVLSVCTSVWFVLAMPLQSASSSVAVVPISAASGITLSPFDVDKHPVFSKWFLQPEWFDERPYTLLMRNITTVPVTAITVKWQTTDDSGSTKTWSFSSDSYYISKTPLLDANSEAAVYPSGYFPASLLKDSRQGFISTRPTSSAKLENLRRSKVTVTLDVAIFADGRIVGPDEYRTALSIEARNQMAHELARYMRNGLAQTRDVNALVSRVVVPGGDAPSDPLAMWTHRFIKLLRTAPDVTPVLRQLENVPDAPRFHR